MADYVAREWSNGDIVTAANLNRMEQGIEDAGSGQVLVVTDTNGTLDKTWQEIYYAFPNCYIVEEGNGKRIIIEVRNSDYSVRCYRSSTYYIYTTSSSDGYPYHQR